MIALFGSFTFGIPAMLRIRIMPKTETITLAGGLVALLFLGGATLLRWRGFDEEHRRNIRLLWIAVPVTMLPEMAGMVEGRGSLLAGVLFAGLLVLSPLSRLAAAAFIYVGAANLSQTGRDSDTGCAAGQDVYQINSDSLMAVMSPFVVARAQGAFFDEWNQLGQAQRDLTLTRTDKSTLRLEALEGVVESYLWLFRRPETPWSEGTPVTKGSLRATVIAVEENIPTVVDFHIEGLSENLVCLIRADGFLLKNLPVPAVGESVVVPWVPPMTP